MATTPDIRNQENHGRQAISQVLNLNALWSDARPPEQHRNALEQARIRHELTLAFTDLGGATFALAHHGALHNPRLAGRVQRIEQLYARLAEFDETERDHTLTRAAA